MGINVDKLIALGEGKTPTYLKSLRKGDIVLQDDSNGNGPYIKSWNHPDAQPSNTAINAWDNTADLKARKAIEKRRLAYPSIIDQLDMMYWDQINGTTFWKDEITTIKVKYPKS